MTTLAPQLPIPLDNEIEIAVRARLSQHFAPIYGARVDSYVDTLMATDHYRTRLDYFLSVVDGDFLNQAPSALISGYGAGSEMILARQYGMGKIYGVEVDALWEEVARMRMSALGDMYPTYYAGDYLPYQACLVDIVLSGHVIEHTSEPKLYLNEMMRVLKPGGYLYLEFPHRYHWRELHTNLPSFEWLPQPMRDSILRLLISPHSPLTPEYKQRYKGIIDTNLKSISLGSLLKVLKYSGYRWEVLNSYRPIPGVIRCVIRKG